MKIRKDDGSELKKEEYAFGAGKEKFVLKANDEELDMYTTIFAEKIRPYIKQNLVLHAENQVLRRRLLKLGIHKDELLWAKNEPRENIPGTFILPT